MTAPTNQTDRDLLIRVDADVRHLTNGVKEVKEAQIELAHQQQELGTALQTLTYNMGAMVEGMKEAKTGLHEQTRLANDVEDLKLWRAEHDKTHREGFETLSRGQQDAIARLEAVMTQDREQWRPWVTLAGHWKWLAVGGAAIITFVGWPTIKMLLARIASM